MADQQPAQQTAQQTAPAPEQSEEEKYRVLLEEMNSKYLDYLQSLHRRSPHLETIIQMIEILEGSTRVTYNRLVIINHQMVGFLRAKEMERRMETCWTASEPLFSGDVELMDNLVFDAPEDRGGH